MSRASRERGQILNDYVIGIGIFLLTVAFVFAFIPNVLSPYFDGAQDGQPILAERSAERLAGQLLADESSAPTKLDAQCTFAFFQQSTPGPGCGFGAGWSGGEEEYLRDALGLDSTVGVYVAIVDDSGHVADMTVGGTTESLELGDDSPGRSAISVTRQVILQDEPCRLRVILW
jgi:hypothetical protein